MRLLYLECNMGAAGDMLASALTALLPEPEQREFISRMNSLGLPGVTLTLNKSERAGILGTHIDVKIPDCGHSHSSLGDMNALLAALPLPDSVKKDASEVYALLAEAEAEVHGRPVGLVHLHEVGALDAAADIVGVCLLLGEYIRPARIAASPVRTGFGMVETRHGILPVPAPATALLLRGIPVYAGEIRGEMCTPTGAALLRRFAGSFGEMPPMRISETGYGMGTKDFPAANCVRAFLGEASDGDSGERVAELCCQLDDMTPEAIGFAIGALLKGGALDAFTLPATMKKSRPGQLFVCVCHENRAEEMAELMFKHSSTLGVRIKTCLRRTLSRETVIADTEYGPIRVKRSWGYGTEKMKPEYDDASKAAKAFDAGLGEVYSAVGDALKKLRQE